jgi:hypothetical protein
MMLDRVRVRRLRVRPAATPSAGRRLRPRAENVFYQEYEYPATRDPYMNAPRSLSISTIGVTRKDVTQ